MLVLVKFVVFVQRKQQMPKRARSGSMSGSASAKKRFRRGRYPYARRYRPQYVRPGYGLVGRTPGGAVLGEMKYFDTAFQGLVPGNNGWNSTILDPTTFNTLCVPVVGAAYNQRIGKEINILKIRVHGKLTFSFKSDSGAAFSPTLVRLGLVQDMQTNSAQCLGSQVMTPTSISAQAPLTYQNIDNFGRFKVLKDKFISIQDPNLVGSNTIMDANGLVKHFKWTIKFRVPPKMRFNQVNGGTIADIIDNSFHIFANSDQANVITLDYLCRVGYKE